MAEERKKIKNGFKAQKLKKVLLRQKPSAKALLLLNFKKTFLLTQKSMMSEP
jgi:hypothetical protein